MVLTSRTFKGCHIATSFIPWNSFPGDRFVRSEADKDMVIILDGNGYIAGMQSVIMKEKVTDEFIDYANNPYYVLDAWFSEEAYFTTAYFVDTAIICNGGRYCTCSVFW